jgi:hypothetical protein
VIPALEIGSGISISRTSRTSEPPKPSNRIAFTLFALRTVCALTHAQRRQIGETPSGSSTSNAFSVNETMQ